MLLCHSRSQCSFSSYSRAEEKTSRRQGKRRGQALPATDASSARSTGLTPQIEVKAGNSSGTKTMSVGNKYDAVAKEQPHFNQLVALDIHSSGSLSQECRRDTSGTGGSARKQTADVTDVARVMKEIFSETSLLKHKVGEPSATTRTNVPDAQSSAEMNLQTVETHKVENEIQSAKRMVEDSSSLKNQEAPYNLNKAEKPVSDVPHPVPGDLKTSKSVANKDGDIGSSKVAAENDHVKIPGVEVDSSVIQLSLGNAFAAKSPLEKCTADQLVEEKLLQEGETTNNRRGETCDVGVYLAEEKASSLSSEPIASASTTAEPLPTDKLERNMSFKVKEQTNANSEIETNSEVLQTSRNDEVPHVDGESFDIANQKAKEDEAKSSVEIKPSMLETDDLPNVGQKGHSSIDMQALVLVTSNENSKSADTEQDPEESVPVQGVDMPKVGTADTQMEDTDDGALLVGCSVASEEKEKTLQPNMPNDDSISHNPFEKIKDSEENGLYDGQDPSSSPTVAEKNIEGQDQDQDQVKTAGFAEKNIEGQDQDQVKTAGCELVDISTGCSSEPQVQLLPSAESEGDMHVHLEETKKSETMVAEGTELPSSLPMTEEENADIEPSSTLTAVHKNTEDQDQAETAGCELVDNSTACSSQPQVQLPPSVEPVEAMHIHLEATKKSETVFAESQLGDIEPSSSLTAVHKNIEDQDQAETAGCELVDVSTACSSEPQVQLPSSAEPEEGMHVHLEAAKKSETMVAEGSEFASSLPMTKEENAESMLADVQTNIEDQDQVETAECESVDVSTGCSSQPQVQLPPSPDAVGDMHVHSETVVGEGTKCLSSIPKTDKENAENPPDKLDGESDVAVVEGSCVESNSLVAEESKAEETKGNEDV
ncbi:unnamed protein product [Arabidopsis arenosa]|uniref:Uncharacterized protein n=1 Tax=Arabidopsis arenosa TaxID=38785 RepID=A0A8S2A4P2_ARAAE|nr:unnamed protein product [Arabidopsis arenosa]